jgi:hypothetical protein
MEPQLASQHSDRHSKQVVTIRHYSQKTAQCRWSLGNDIATHQFLFCSKAGALENCGCMYGSTVLMTVNQVISTLKGEIAWAVAFGVFTAIIHQPSLRKREQPHITPSTVKWRRGQKTKLVDPTKTLLNSETTPWQCSTSWAMHYAVACETFYFATWEKCTLAFLWKQTGRTTVQKEARLPGALCR